MGTELSSKESRPPSEPEISNIVIEELPDNVETNPEEVPPQDVNNDDSTSTASPVDIPAADTQFRPNSEQESSQLPESDVTAPVMDQKLPKPSKTPPADANLESPCISEEVPVAHKNSEPALVVKSTLPPHFTERNSPLQQPEPRTGLIPLDPMSQPGLVANGPLSQIKPISPSVSVVKCAGPSSQTNSVDKKHGGKAGFLPWLAGGIVLGASEVGLATWLWKKFGRKGGSDPGRSHSRDLNLEELSHIKLGQNF